jgi:Ras GTPase-activating-like protein IQGAP2/3
MWTTRCSSPPTYPSLTVLQQFCFELTDLYDKKNIPKVIYCIHALSYALFSGWGLMGRYILSSTGQASPINDLVGLLEFTEDELLKTQKGLDAAGITLPNFKNVGKELAKEPTPEPEETEQERIDRELRDCEASIIAVQAVARGSRVRDDVRRTKNRLRRMQEGIVGAQSLARGFLVRGVFEDHIQSYRQSKQWAIKVPSHRPLRLTA